MALLSTITLPVLAFTLGCAMLTFILLKRSYRYFGRTSRSRGSKPLELQPRPSSKWDGMHRDTLAVVERQKVEMHDMARELTGQLSTKIVVLEKLISDSQRQIDRMEMLVEDLENRAVSGKR